MSRFLALDQGTSSSRAMIFDQAATCLASAHQPLELAYPHPGWVEADPRQIWDSVLASARAALAATGTEHIAAIGIATQRETTLLWDRASGAPLYPAIVWQDRRTSARCEALRADGLEELVRSKTGLLIDPYFSATKLAWLLERLPGARERAERGELCFGTVDSWLVYQLSGGREHLTDPSNAARTMLFNIHTQHWDADLLALFDIPAALLPRVVPSSSLCGHSAPHWFGRAIPIGGLAGDQQAACFGQECASPGMVKNTYGTGCFMLAHAGAQAPRPGHGLLTTLACSGGSIGSGVGHAGYLVEGSVFMGGAIVHWLASLGIVAGSDSIEALATSVPDSGGVTLVPAFAGLGAPYWDAGARASLAGMSRATGKAHIARAGLEAVALQCADVLDLMQASAGLSELRVDGGACRNDFLMQYQADLLGVPVLRPLLTETTALGAARLAAQALGQDAPGWRLGRRFEPTWSADRRGQALANWRRAVAHTRQWRPDGQHD